VLDTVRVGGSQLRQKMGRKQDATGGELHSHSVSRCRTKQQASPDATRGCVKSLNESGQFERNVRFQLLYDVCPLCVHSTSLFDLH